MLFSNNFINLAKIKYVKEINIGEDSKYYMYCDGGSRGNPGIAGSGVVISEDEECTRVIVEMIIPLGKRTNNEAEWAGLMMGVLLAKNLGIKNLHVKLDSELVVNQINGKYKVKNEGLKPFYNETRDIVKVFNGIKVSHVRREYNKHADRLSNIAMDIA